MGEVTVYSTDPCGYCTRTKALLKARGIEFTEVNLSRDPGGRVQLAGKTGMMTFPQVLVGDRLIGGFDEVRAAVENGRLEELLAV